MFAGFVNFAFRLKHLFFSHISNKLVTIDSGQWIKVSSNLTIILKGVRKMPETEALARNIKLIRKNLQQSQFEFAANCGLSNDVILQLENKQTNPKLSTLQDIAAYVGITVSELLKIYSEDEHTYCLRIDSYVDEEGKSHTLYGIDAIDNKGLTVLSFPGVFCDKAKAVDLIKLCNEGDLSIIHLANVVEDALT